MRLIAATRLADLSVRVAPLPLLMVCRMREMSDVEFVAWFAGAVAGGWEPLQGGQWENDDEWAALLPQAPPMSELVGDLASTASAMHEGVLALAFAPEAERPTNVVISQMVMARSAIECLAAGLWLCLPQDANERAKRYLSLGFQDIGDMLGFGGGPRSDLPKEGVRLLAAMGVDARPGISATHILAAVDTALGNDALPIWRLYSGVAHGRPWARQALRTNFPEPTTNGAHLRQAIDVLAPATKLARSLLEVIDLRRRFPRPTELETERLKRIQNAT